MFSYTPNAYVPVPKANCVTTLSPCEQQSPTPRYERLTSSYHYEQACYTRQPHLLPNKQTSNHRVLCHSVCGLGSLNRGRADLTQSVIVHPTSDQHGIKARFVESVQVLPEPSSRHQVRPSIGSIANLQRQQASEPRILSSPSQAPSPVLEQYPEGEHSVGDARRSYNHNILSPDMRQRMLDRKATARMRSQVTRSLDFRQSPPTSPSKSDRNGQAQSPLTSHSKIDGNGQAQQRVRGNSLENHKAFHSSIGPSSWTGRQNSLEELQCSCKLYHSHTFKGRPINRDLVQETHKFIDTLTSPSKPEETENHEDLHNIFWTPSLSFHPYHPGDKKVEFSDLWPNSRDLQQHFQNSGIQHTVLRDYSVLDLCRLAIVCGPLRLLKCLIDLDLVRVDQLLENGSGLLHLSVLSHNVEAIQYLTSIKISPKLRDRSGLTADQVCYNSSIRRHLPPKYIHKESSRLQMTLEGKMLLKASLQDKDTIFKLASNPKNFDEIQKKLQSLDFNVNTECDTNGDFLLHIVCRRGLSQLPLIMALVKIQGADVELCNADGETPLMIAAAAGNPVLCDVLMCLFGADPNKPNPNTGRCALHYAVEGNHRKTVECLIRRGADVNCEDLLGRRPDDVPLCQGTNEDCHELIHFNRTRRMEALVERIRKGELEKHHLSPSDLFVVDDDGYTLVMTASIYNKPDALKVLLISNDTTIDAQHIKTGMTALAIAAQMGNAEAVSNLLNHGANPAIADMKGYLPLHYAVLNNQEKVVDTMLEYFPQCYCGLYMATRLCKRTSIHVKLKSAFTRRQEEIVTPKLLACAMDGAADELYQLLDDGDNINPKSGTGNWPLYLAVENGHLEVVKLLFERGGDIRKRHSTTGETVLHIAAKMGHTEITRFLLCFCRQSYLQSSSSSTCQLPRKLMDINTTDTNNRTPLQVAAEKGFSKIVQLLLQHGATTALLDAGGQLITCPQYEGVRMQIEVHRQQHTKDVVALITDRNKKAFEQLQAIWLPRFDHNLRTKLGDTPLMVACALGKLQILKFFLESAIYTPSQPDDDSDDDSDADSGVLAPSEATFRKHPAKFEMVSSATHSVEMPQGQLVSSGDCGHSTETVRPNFTDPCKSESDTATSLPRSSVDSAQRTLETLLHDVNRPKGLYIFQDGVVSHVCAVNLFEGSTALHRAIESGDNVQLVKVLQSADNTCINIQNDAGLTPLHLACKLGRKKVVEFLLGTEGVDLNARTLESLLPEELTTTKSIIKLVQKARAQNTIKTSPLQRHSDVADEFQDDASSIRSRSLLGSAVNFDNLHRRYEALRKEVKHPATLKHSLE